MQPGCNRFKFTDFNNYLVYEICKYLPFKERLRYSRVNKNFDEVLNQVWYRNETFAIRICSENDHNLDCNQLNISNPVVDLAHNRCLDSKHNLHNSDVFIVVFRNNYYYLTIVFKAIKKIIKKSGNLKAFYIHTSNLFSNNHDENDKASRDLFNLLNQDLINQISRKLKKILKLLPHRLQHLQLKLTDDNNYLFPFDQLNFYDNLKQLRCFSIDNRTFNDSDKKKIKKVIANCHQLHYFRGELSENAFNLLMKQNPIKKLDCEVKDLTNKDCKLKSGKQRCKLIENLSKLEAINFNQDTVLYHFKEYGLYEHLVQLINLKQLKVDHLCYTKDLRDDIKEYLSESGSKLQVLHAIQLELNLPDVNNITTISLVGNTINSLRFNNLKEIAIPNFTNQDTKRLKLILLNNKKLRKILIDGQTCDEIMQSVFNYARNYPKRNIIFGAKKLTTFQFQFKFNVPINYLNNHKLIVNFDIPPNLSLFDCDTGSYVLEKREVVNEDDANDTLIIEPIRTKSSAVYLLTN